MMRNGTSTSSVIFLGSEATGFPPMVVNFCRQEIIVQEKDDDARNNQNHRKTLPISKSASPHDHAVRVRCRKGVRHQNGRIAKFRMSHDKAQQTCLQDSGASRGMVTVRMMVISEAPRS